MIVSAFTSCNTSGGKMSSDQDSLAYAAGVFFGNNLKEFGTDVDVNKVAEGIRDVLKGKEKMTMEQANEVVRNYFMVVKPAKVKQESEAFLAKVEKDNKNVKKTSSGLLYEIIEEGDVNLKPALTDTVKVHYTGTLPNGDTFDSSVERGEPVDFPLNRVIPGWSEGVQLIGKGGKIKLWVPSQLGYGEQGAGGKIGPNQALMFEVELLDVKKAGDSQAEASAQK